MLELCCSERRKKRSVHLCCGYKKSTPLSNHHIIRFFISTSDSISVRSFSLRKDNLSMFTLSVCQFSSRITRVLIHVSVCVHRYLYILLCVVYPIRWLCVFSLPVCLAVYGSHSLSHREFLPISGQKVFFDPLPCSRIGVIKGNWVIDASKDGAGAQVCILGK